MAKVLIMTLLFLMAVSEYLTLPTGTERLVELHVVLQLAKPCLHGLELRGEILPLGGTRAATIAF
jgi:hypothetical protein